jgi:cardiolipin synthase
MNKNVNIPNALSILRLLGVPVFIYFALISKQDGFAILVLVVAGITDYLDGKLARAWNQTSAFGALIDPAADRIYILSTLIILFVRDAISLWVLIILIARDAILAVLTLILKSR